MFFLGGGDGGGVILFFIVSNAEIEYSILVLGSGTKLKIYQWSPSKSICDINS